MKYEVDLPSGYEAILHPFLRIEDGEPEWNDLIIPLRRIPPTVTLTLRRDVAVEYANLPNPLNTSDAHLKEAAQAALAASDAPACTCGGVSSRPVGPQGQQAWVPGARPTLPRSRRRRGGAGAMTTAPPAPPCAPSMLDGGRNRITVCANCWRNAPWTCRAAVDEERRCDALAEEMR